jgi:hypothetical protein
MPRGEGHVTTIVIAVNKTNWAKANKTKGVSSGEAVEV